MNKLNQLFHPITAAPFQKDSTYVEILPCDALKPFIRCFWGMKRPIITKKQDIITRKLIVPDTCMDIIFDINYTENKISSEFCGIDDETFELIQNNDKEEMLSSFAIRFYGWTAILFAEENMTEVKNKFYDAGEYFSKIKNKIEPYLFEVSAIEERISIAEKILINHLHLERINNIAEEALYKILNSKGNVNISKIAKEIHISNRQLERIFMQNLGLSPKKFSSLIRYQNLWNDILYYPERDIQDAVLCYGYTDQSHLLRDFKRFHTISPNMARKLALSNTTLNHIIK